MKHWSQLLNKMGKNKRALGISFAWLFAIIVGGFILFLAIYGTTKTIESGQLETSAKTGKELGILLNPLETGFESGSSVALRTPVETRIFNNCYNYDEFGEQAIQISERSFNKWPDPILENTFKNKYIFSPSPSQGRQFYIFSKPFEFPFKIADVVYLTSLEDKYCFINAPLEINEELLDLEQPNLFVDNCPEESIQVCFDSINCDIDVSYSEGIVEKNNYRVYFKTDALMYAAIFGNQEIYECQVDRLMQRTKSLAQIYKEKSDLLSGKGCQAELDVSLITFSNLVSSFEDSYSLFEINDIINNLKYQNEFADCPLW